MSDTLDKKQILEAVSELIQYTNLENQRRVKLKINLLISNIERGQFDTKEPAE